MSLPGGIKVNVVTYDMEDFLTSAVSKYVSLAERLQGTKVSLRTAHTPCIVEDQKLAPAGAPLESGPCVTCPWCKFAFSPDTGADLCTKLKNSPDPEPVGGALQSLAASILMKVLYAARMARFDLLYAVSRLACYISKWTPLCDKRLHRIMCYINTTKH